MLARLADRCSGLYLAPFEGISGFESIVEEKTGVLAETATTVEKEDPDRALIKPTIVVSGRSHDEIGIAVAVQVADRGYRSMMPSLSRSPRGVIA